MIQKFHQDEPPMKIRQKIELKYNTRKRVSATKMFVFAMVVKHE